MNIGTFVTELHSVCHFQTKEGSRVGRASNSEIRRWFKNKAVVVNGERSSFDDPIPEKWESLILFPNKPITLW